MQKGARWYLLTLVGLIIILGGIFLITYFERPLFLYLIIIFFGTFLMITSLFRIAFILLNKLPENIGKINKRIKKSSR